MSADNWAVCPRCAVRDPFMGNDMRSHTFREDYEVYVDRDGEFVVEYRGRCTQCDLRHEFKHRAMVAGLYEKAKVRR